MTVEEAIEYFELIKLSVPKEEDKYFDVAIQALQKQVPTQPIEEDFENDIDFLCPICGNSVLDAIVGEIEFCHDCGQRILWEDEE